MSGQSICELIREHRSECLRGEIHQDCVKFIYDSPEDSKKDFGDLVKFGLIEEVSGEPTYS